MTRETLNRGYVVVGFDGWLHPTETLGVAADEAVRRGVGLAVVTVLRHRLDPNLSIHAVRREQQRAQATALQELHAAAVSLHPNHPDLPVTTYCLGESEVAPDRDPLNSAELLVLGTHGRHGRQALSLESVSRLLLTSSRCPILVVPDGRPGIPILDEPRLPLILVGVSAHPTDSAVVRAAYGEAAGRGGEVRLVHAYSQRPTETAEQARDRARSVVSPYLEQAPEGLPVSESVTEDDPATALIRLSDEATLLVIGGRTGSLSGLVRGSVSREILEAVPCPVLAIPRNITAGPPGPLTGIALAPASTTAAPSH